VHAGVRRAAAARAAHEDAASTTDLLGLWESEGAIVVVGGVPRYFDLAKITEVALGSRRPTFARTSCPGKRSTRRPR
jgi:hypothetical protein